MIWEAALPPAICAIAACAAYNASVRLHVFHDVVSIATDILPVMTVVDEKFVGCLPAVNSWKTLCNISLRHSVRHPRQFTVTYS